MVSRIINQYVDDVTQQLPMNARKAVENDLKNLIYGKLDDYTDGQRAVSRDVRAVLRELGSPDEIAYIYYKDISRQKIVEKKKKRQRMADVTGLILRLSAALIIVGLLLLMSGVTSNVLPLVTGALIALIVTFIRLFGPEFEQLKSDKRRALQDSKASSEEEEFFWSL